MIGERCAIIEFNINLNLSSEENNEIQCQILLGEFDFFVRLIVKMKFSKFNEIVHQSFHHKMVSWVWYKFLGGNG